MTYLLVHLQQEIKQSNHNLVEAKDSVVVVVVVIVVVVEVEVLLLFSIGSPLEI